MPCYSLQVSRTHDLVYALWQPTVRLRLIHIYQGQTKEEKNPNTIGHTQTNYCLFMIGKIRFYKQL
jgi:hypothetical protein